jgi:phage anti-repressor protein
MQKTEKKLYDEQGNLIIRPYRLKDLAAIYDVSTRTMRRWIDAKAAEYGKKEKKYFTITQVNGIINAIGLPQKISLVIPMQQLKQAV